VKVYFCCIEDLLQYDIVKATHTNKKYDLFNMLLVLRVGFFLMHIYIYEEIKYAMNSHF